MNTVEYLVEFSRETDGQWLGEISALPGVMAYGETVEKAFINTQVLALHVLAERLEHGELEACNIVIRSSVSPDNNYYGVARIRDAEHPCLDYQPGIPEGACESDGHHLCKECVMRAKPVPQALIDRVKEAVKDVEVDLDKPLSPEDE